MPPVTSNNGGHLPNLDNSAVEEKGFQMGPILSSDHIGAIYTICLKYGLFKPLKTILRQIG